MGAVIGAGYSLIQRPKERPPRGGPEYFRFVWLHE
jgi:hypothetical protein